MLPSTSLAFFLQNAFSSTLIFFQVSKAIPTISSSSTAPKASSATLAQLRRPSTTDGRPSFSSHNRAGEMKTFLEGSEVSFDNVNLNLAWHWSSWSEPQKVHKG